ncbi:hypothetical protein GDO81_015525 [Engystomops pustulosus]|uniref:Uncharacterized protein n=1 Tax=Engystomops pustulosus TaxID=76066 RepID=A0AAV7APC2_ENGPU|nr:hypothetical protein GDO81_015525 [Engystomops pustulosus]
MQTVGYHTASFLESEFPVRCFFQETFRAEIVSTCPNGKRKCKILRLLAAVCLYFLFFSLCQRRFFFILENTCTVTDPLLCLYQNTNKSKYID